MTLAEHDAFLKATGQYDSMLDHRRRQEEERQERVAALQQALVPFFNDLRAKGYDIESVSALIAEPFPTRAPIPEAIPILLDHLQRPYPTDAREVLARAVAVPEAKCGWDILIRLYREAQEKRPKDALAVALARAADDDVLDEVIALAKDPRHGSSRILLLHALECSASSLARAALADLADDPDLKKEVGLILKRIGRKKRKS
ncbi:MAG: hypothetical protein HC927_04240 [Deltaproteobacteria bacterium]|nr:hypothetical protein [Deltaproteobacteria bacterium]